ncbi:MAG TPA: undecaprenyl-phosphate glucose phosphotransferase [Vicinamibacteria bacterium]|nr:undecaprenyl-phosphate glucose phosphotransferase [Vicinamibacteria bacterium]
MLRVQANRLPAIYVLTDLVVTGLAWLLAFVLRFELGLLPAPKGVPPFDQYLLLMPLIVLVWPGVLYFHGLYQVRRGRSRIDEFFSILFSVLNALLVILGFTLYVRVYYFYGPESAQWEFSQAVWGIFFVLDVLGLAAGRWAIRAWLERLWASGYGVKNVLVAGTGELGRMVAETLATHRELGYRVVGFIDDAPAAQAQNGLPVLGRFDQVLDVAKAHAVEQLYIALPLEEHGRVLELIRCAGNECLDLKVVPDLVQYATLQSALEDLDGIPIISLNDVPLRGWNSMLKRLMDLGLGLVLLAPFAVAYAVIAVFIKLRGGPGPVLIHQERMTLDGRTFQIYKFRSMVIDAERDTGPVFATSDDPRRTPVGAFLRRHNLDELPQLLNVLMGDMSLVGPRPERPPFVQQFKQRIPQYMLRHRVKSGMTGWAQINGWRGNTSIEKRIEYDLYYIENWSLLLDVKILILTLFRGFGQKHAY